MIKVKVGSKIFVIPKVSRQDVSMTKVDWLAERFYETKDEKCINTLICIVSRYVRAVANSFCKDTEDVKELDQELKIDLVRLLRGWKPKEGKCFHYLMKRQLYNFSCNFFNKRSKKPLFVDVEQVQQDLLLNSDFVKDLERKDLIEKLKKQVNDKTKEIFDVMLSGVTNFGEIGRELNMSGDVVRNRLKRCKPKLQKLLKEEKCIKLSKR